MAYWTNALNKIGAEFIGKNPDTQLVNILLSNSDGTPDLLQGDGAGGIRVSYAAKSGTETTICDLDGLAVATSNYDLSMSTAKDFGLVVSGKSDTVNTVKIAILVCNDLTGATPTYAPITASILDATSNVALVPDSAGDVVVAIGATATTVFWTAENIPASRIRIRVTVATPDADNALKIAAFVR